MTETDRPDPAVADPTAADTASTAEPLLDHDPAVESVAAAVADGTDREPAAIRRDLDPFSDDGVLTRDAVATTVSDVSQILATAETRVDLAARAVDDVRATADPLADIDVVHHRLRALEHRLAALQRRTVELGETVHASRNRLDTPTAIHRSAVELRETAADAQRVVRVADDLASDVDAFESWLESPAERTAALAADVDALEEALGELSTTVERLAGSSGSNGEQAPAQAWVDAPAQAWVDAVVHTRVLELLVTDLRTESADLRRWADRADASVPAPLPSRIDAADRRRSTLSATLSDLAAPDWRDRFADRLEATDRALARFDPPVAWDRVREAMAEIPE
ncbi:halo transducer protein [Halopenitus persicus]|uniref:halo transducer protein n=1 Tax=Halopenitus persicus TaxID=1048396 RepID=UPI000BBADC72|nr:halo transducer protein [Halopenitus persicus]